MSIQISGSGIIDPVIPSMDRSCISRVPLRSSAPLEGIPTLIRARWKGYERPHPPVLDWNDLDLVEEWLDLQG